MGFFGHTIDKEALEVPIPDGHELEFSRICSFPEGKYSDKPVFLYVQTPNEEEPYVVSVIHPSKGIYQSEFNHIFYPEDSPVSVWTSGPKVHLTGNWTWDKDAKEDENDEDEEEEGEDEEEDDDGVYCMPCNEEEEEEEEEVEVEEPKKSENKRKSKEEDEQSLKKKIKDEKSIKEEKKEKAPIDEEETEEKEEYKLSPWIIVPFADEALPVSNPKPISKAEGLVITDYLIGKGAKVKAGGNIKILYEGFFPNGYLFDANIRRKNPFSFRKGTGMVIKGLDLGIEGMKSGGAREIRIPSKLG